METEQYDKESISLDIITDSDWISKKLIDFKPT